MNRAKTNKASEDAKKLAAIRNKMLGQANHSNNIRRTLLSEMDDQKFIDAITKQTWDE